MLEPDFPGRSFLRNWRGYILLVLKKIGLVLALRVLTTVNGIPSGSGKSFVVKLLRNFGVKKFVNKVNHKEQNICGPVDQNNLWINKQAEENNQPKIPLGFGFHVLCTLRQARHPLLQWSINLLWLRITWYESEPFIVENGRFGWGQYPYSIILKEQRGPRVRTSNVDFFLFQVKNRQQALALVW